MPYTYPPCTALISSSKRNGRRFTRFHEALGIYQKEMTKTGGEGLNRGGGGKNYSIDATAMVG